MGRENSGQTQDAWRYLWTSIVGYRSGVQGCLPTHLPQKLIQTMRDEVNTCFLEILHEIKQLQMKVLDFVEKEEATALGKLGNSIQQSHNRLLKLEGDSVWLHSLLANRNDEQFLQARPPLNQALFFYRGQGLPGLGQRNQGVGLHHLAHTD